MTSARRDALTAAGLAGVAVLACLPALWTDFTADDFFILGRVQELGGLAHLAAYFQFGFFDYYRPLTFLSHALDWHLWDLDATGYHLTGIILHAASTVLVFVLGRRIAGVVPSAVAALLFGLHPANQEVVYWMAARFDALATLLTLLALVWLQRDGRWTYAAGVAAFALALLAKESALALPPIALAWDVFVARRTPRSAVARLVPLLAVAAGYAALRSVGADLDAAGGRLPKLLMMMGTLAALLAVAAAGVDRVCQALGSARLPGPGPIWLGLPAVLVVAALASPLARWTLEKLGFIAWVGFETLSPIVLPPPPPWPFVPAAPMEAMPGVIVALVVVATLWWRRRWIAERGTAVFLLVFIACALLPVSSMTGGARYLYLASAGAALLAGLAFESTVGVRRAWAVGLVATVLTLSATNLVVGARAWEWAGTMTRDAVAVMDDDGPGCETRTVLLVTAPAGIRGVYSNIVWDTFKVRTECPPLSLAALLRVVRVDATVEAAWTAADRLDIRVPGYRGQFVATRDLRRYDVPVAAGTTFSIDTPVGLLETWPDGEAQHFRLTRPSGAAPLSTFVYSDGRVNPLARIGEQAAARAVESQRETPRRRKLAEDRVP